MGANAVKSHGTIIARQAGGAGSFVDIGELTDITAPPFTRNPIEALSQTDEDDYYVVGMRRTGEMTFGINYNPTYDIARLRGGAHLLLGQRPARRLADHLSGRRCIDADLLGLRHQHRAHGSDRRHPDRAGHGAPDRRQDPRQLRRESMEKDNIKGTTTRTCRRARPRLTRRREVVGEVGEGKEQPKSSYRLVTGKRPDSKDPASRHRHSKRSTRVGDTIELTEEEVAALNSAVPASNRSAPRKRRRWRRLRAEVEFKQAQVQLGGARRVGLQPGWASGWTGWAGYAERAGRWCAGPARWSTARAPAAARGCWPR